MIEMKMMDKLLRLPFLMLLAFCVSCNSNKQTGESENTNQKFPSDVISNLDNWKILLGNGESVDSLQNFEHEDYFYDVNDGQDWIVYKAPNGGITSPNSHNTRSELGQKYRWTPKEGGKLTGTLKVMHVSTSGDARVAASYSVVVGQIHSADGHENEPLKIFFKKFPGHTKGSVFWNYEINTEGDDNSGRWDFSTAIWGYDMSVVGSDSVSYPTEPEDGIELGEEFSYEINVYDGMMYLTFISEGHETKTFIKNLLVSDFQSKEDIPEQTMNLFVPIGQDGVERANAYEGETQFFKQGAYNQTNGRDPETNLVWSTGSNTYSGDVEAQYANGSFTEVWFRESSVGPGTSPNQ
ncbi:polysaccharide lyase family 7 protein [Ekhidna sp.]|uniref:polysaccharide lyase family 7 protein n=2 Tax=Ekhidna sp. TaxID=2608089 RepID=UPI003C7CD1F2